MSTWTFAKTLARKKKYFAISEKNFSRDCSLHTQRLTQRKPLSWTFCSTLMCIYCEEYYSIVPKKRNLGILKRFHEGPHPSFPLNLSHPQIFHLLQRKRLELCWAGAQHLRRQLTAWWLNLMHPKGAVKKSCCSWNASETQSPRMQKGRKIQIGRQWSKYSKTYQYISIYLPCFIIPVLSF